MAKYDCTYQPEMKDLTATKAWKQLVQHKRQLDAEGMDLRRWFQEDPDRTSRLSFETCDYLFDLSRNLVTDETLDLLCELAQEMGLSAYQQAMISGEHINVSEDRAVLHTALRRGRTEEPIVNDEGNLSQKIQDELDRMYRFAHMLHAGALRGFSGKKFTHVLNIGIGGSDLGPSMFYEAMAPLLQYGIECSYVSNLDAYDLQRALKDLDPETTLVLVVSKSFKTMETLTNAAGALHWLHQRYEALGYGDCMEGDQDMLVATQFVGVSSEARRVQDFGIRPEYSFSLFKWVGGRYSVDSACGLSLIIAFGEQVFQRFLSGFRAMDRHFLETPFRSNVCVLMALINLWYVDFLGAQTHAVIPYSEQLAQFPAYLQQLTMESNGKSVTQCGHKVSYDTGEIYWGQAGINGQHAFFQLMHQGTHLVPADFIAYVTPFVPKDQMGQVFQMECDTHEMLLANFLAQTKALAFGRTAEETRTMGVDEAHVAARTFQGNKPSTSILGKQLTPEALGSLIALYEHIVFTEGCLWGINSFDQWGVEIGKTIAKDIAPAFRDQQAMDRQDSSTKQMIAFCRHQAIK